MARRKISRRRAVTSILALGGVTFGLVARVKGERSCNLPAYRIRPPGALHEAEFLGACVRCGLCVQACPYDTLHLAELSPLLPTGTPYFTARDTPCHMCETIPCAAACPTGALQLSTINAAAMGLAELSTPERCHSYTGAAYCNSCYQACPLKGQAIHMQPGRTLRGGNFRPVVNADYCTGCGLCEAACVLQGDAAITVRAANHATRR